MKLVILLSLFAIFVAGAYYLVKSQNLLQVERLADRADGRRAAGRNSSKYGCPSNLVPEKTNLDATGVFGG